MPLVAHSVFLLGGAGAAVVAGVTIALVAGQAAWLRGLEGALEAGLGGALATGFVVLFSNVARLEVAAPRQSSRAVRSAPASSAAR